MPKFRTQHIGAAPPLLAFTLRQLAEDLPAGGTLSLSRYRELGDVQGALAWHADAAFTEAVQTSGLTDRDIWLDLLAWLPSMRPADATGDGSG